MPRDINRKIAETFLAIADGLETGSFGKKPKVAVTALGSEHGEENIMAGALRAAANGVDVIYIGTLSSPEITSVYAECEADAHKRMEELLNSGEADAAVTMHYPFPIGVSTVGLACTPAKGRNMYIATTTGTAAVGRVESMIRNTVAGIITAKASGIKQPTVGILNVEGARRTEAALIKLNKGGYGIAFASSGREDGGSIMRGNDVLTGAPDIIVTDSLTGNILSKMLSSFNSGGSFEAAGWGYGPGIGKGYERLVMIVSRASGAPVIAGAIEYAAVLIKGKVFEVAKREYAAVEKAGIERIIEGISTKNLVSAAENNITVPRREVVTAQINGVDIMELENAVRLLWTASIYAESGMGCTGPVIMVSEASYQKAVELLKSENYLPH